MEICDILSKIGLDSQESAIYVALVKLGPSTISVISKSTNIHRPTIYTKLPLLEKKLLVTKIIKGKQNLYMAEPPEKLENIFRSLKLNFFDAISELDAMYTNSQIKPIVRYFPSKEGITSIFDEVVKSLPVGDTFYRYSAAKDIDKANSYLPKDYREIRDRKRLERKVIMAEDKSSQKKPRLERYIKTIPASTDLFDFDITQIIYGNRVAFIDYNSETGIVIESSVFANFQKSIFKILYSKL